MSDDDFKDYPLSVAEIRSDKSWSASDWNPRDVLISCLREIDKGKIDPISLVVCFSTGDKNDPSVRRTGFRAAGPNIHETVGVVEIAKRLMQQGE